jgi:pilus assembly protein Flp/PilA
MWTDLQELVGAFLSRVRAEEGQTFVEYALLVVFIALVAVLGATLLGNSISSLFSSIATHL